MRHSMTISRMVVAAAAALGLSACSASGTPTVGTASVENAFLAPGAVVVKPYTRTIFSSSNF